MKRVNVDDDHDDDAMSERRKKPHLFNMHTKGIRGDAQREREVDTQQKKISTRSFSTYPPPTSTNPVYIYLTRQALERGQL